MSRVVSHQNIALRFMTANDENCNGLSLNFLQQPHAFKLQNCNKFSMFNGTAFPVSHMMFISIVSKFFFSQMFNGVGKFLATTFQKQRQRFRGRWTGTEMISMKHILPTWKDRYFSPFSGVTRMSPQALWISSSSSIVSSASMSM